MQHYAANILQSISNDFKGYQKQNTHVPDAIDFSTGEIQLEVPDWVKDALAEGLHAAPLGYCDIQGLPDLRELYISMLQRQGYHLDHRNVLVTAGGKEAIWLTFLAKLAPSMKVLLPKPGWPPYSMWTHASNAPAIYYIPASDQIEETLINSLQEHKPAIILLNFPHNPTGAEITQAMLERVLAVAAELNVIVISDEVYRGFATHPEAGSVLANISTGNSETIYIDSVSKSLGLAGLRIGFIVADPGIITQLCTLRSSIASCVSSVAQSALISLLRERRCEHYMQEITTKSRECIDIAVQLLQDTSYDIVSTGAIYLWAKKAYSSSLSADNQIVLHNKVIQIVSGDLFGQSGYIRLCPIRIDKILLSAFPD